MPNVNTLPRTEDTPVTMTPSFAPAVSVPQPTGMPASVPASERPPDLPGCEPIALPASKLDTYEARLEVWDGRTETAWVCEPVTIYHEQPTRRLAKVAERIALVRGSPIESFGSADLLRRDAAGCKRWIMQADEVLYLHPARARVSKRAVEVDEHDLPDVVLEVDHSTDVRRWKLGMYQEWGFPEIWVLVPWEESVRAPGMTIHVREADGGYREARESVAFPGWRAEEIHRALTEEPLSVEAYGALERVGRAMGSREGTGPEDDPLARSLSARARAEGHAEGHAEAVLAVLRTRGIDTAGLAESPGLLVGCSLDTSMAAALACTGAADFQRRLRDASQLGDDANAGPFMTRHGRMDESGRPPYGPASE